MQNKLWTKDFTTITLGSVVSMMGNSIAGFAMSLPHRHEMRPDSPALHAEQLRFPNQTHKDPRFA